LGSMTVNVGDASSNMSKEHRRNRFERKLAHRIRDRANALRKHIAQMDRPDYFSFFKWWEF
jgi:hypothetical protein